jgi:hypothetical protein
MHFANAAAERHNFVARALEAGVRPETRDHSQEMRPRTIQHVTNRGDRNEDVRSSAQTPELRRNHSYDHCRRSIELHGTTNCFLVRVEPLSPEPFAQNHDGGPARVARFLCTEHASRNRSHAQKIEVLRSYPLPHQSLGIPWTGYVAGPIRVTSDVREAPLLVLQHLEFRIGPHHVLLCAHHEADLDKPVRLRKRQCSQQDAIDHAEEAVVAPMPRPSVRIATALKSGFLRRNRNA